MVLLEDAKAVVLADIRVSWAMRVPGADSFENDIASEERSR